MGTYEAPSAIIDKRYGIASAAMAKGLDKAGASIDAAIAAKRKREETAMAKLAKDNLKREKDLFNIQKKVNQTFQPAKTFGNYKVVNGVVQTTDLDAGQGGGTAADGVQDVKEDLNTGMGDLWVDFLADHTNNLEKLPYGSAAYNQELTNITTILELGNVGNGIVNETVQGWENSFYFNSADGRMYPSNSKANGASLFGQSEMQRAFNIAYSNGGVQDGQRVMKYVSNGDRVGLVYTNPNYDPATDPPEMKELFINYKEMIGQGVGKGYQLWSTVDTETFDKKTDQQWDKFAVDYTATMDKIVKESGNVTSTQTIKSYDEANQNLRDKIMDPKNIQMMPIDQNFYQLLRKDGDPLTFDGSDASRTLTAENLANYLIEMKGKATNKSIKTVIDNANKKSSSQKAIDNRATVEGVAGLAPLEGGALAITTGGNPIGDRNGVAWGETGRKYTINELDKLSRYYFNLSPQQRATELGELLTKSSSGGKGNYTSGQAYKKSQAVTVLDAYNTANSSNITDPNPTQVGNILRWASSTQNPNTPGEAYLPNLSSVKNDKLYNANTGKVASQLDSVENILKLILGQLETPANATKILQKRSAPNDPDYIAQEMDYENEAQDFA
tara:strand:+ start:2529 stop:4373 length:1845 start_codon:yes stop_codon:yes gene_type:complete